MQAKQITACLLNKKGALAKVTRLLAAARVNIEGISVVDTTDLGLIRLIVRNASSAGKAFSRAGISFTVQDVEVVRLPDRAGTLAALAAKLAKAGVNINYLYGTTGARAGECRIVISASDLRKVRALAK